MSVFSEFGGAQRGHNLALAQRFAKRRRHASEEVKDRAGTIKEIGVTSLLEPISSQDTRPSLWYSLWRRYLPTPWEIFFIATGCRPVADREELGSSRQINGLRCLPEGRARFEILGDFLALANRPRPVPDTKNPAGVAARGGVKMGLGEHSEPTGPYRLTPEAATSEVGQ